MLRPQTSLSTLMGSMTLLAVSVATVTNALPYNGTSEPLPIYVAVGVWVGIVCFGSAVGMVISGVAWRKPWIGALVGGPLGVGILFFAMPTAVSAFRWAYTLPSLAQLTLVAVLAFLCGWVAHRQWGVISKGYQQAGEGIAK